MKPAPFCSRKTGASMKSRQGNAGKEVLKALRIDLQMLGKRMVCVLLMR